MIGYYCVLLAGIMPMIWAACAKAFGGFRAKDNANPRAFLEKASGKAQRAHWAQQNSWEAFAPFAAAVIIAHLCQADPSRIGLYALTFIAARVLYGIFYIADKPTLRSLVWGVGLIANLGLYYLAFSA